MKQRTVAITLVLLCGCAGPLAIEIALTEQAETDYRERVLASSRNPKEAFLAWQAQQESVSYVEAQARDELLTDNPYELGDRTAVALGAAIYVEHCASCHGFDARGGGPEERSDHPAKDFTTPIARTAIALNGGPPANWFDATHDGKGPILDDVEPPVRAMPAYGDELSNRQIWLVLQYLASRSD